ncbi:unnamed protein product, partial [Effrenium voratum]
KRAAKKEARAAEEAAASAGPKSSSVSPAELLERGQHVVLGSCIVEYAPKLPELLKANGVEEAGPKEKKEPQAEGGVFETLQQRLAWQNCLGLAEPMGPEEAMQKWMAWIRLEIDFGPRKSKRGSPSYDRIMTNLADHLPQYLHILLALAMLHAFLWRSFFACLPWLVLWQMVSLLVPLDTIPEVPQVPLSQCPVKYRVAASVAINGLMLLFFAWELAWQMNFLFKLLVLGLLTLHAHSVKPVAA